MQMSSLVELHVENFKSYVGEHCIGPFSNFSCVIGPNGSGKSNFTDAIGFVLGIDLKYMRVANYRDFVSRGCTHTSVKLVLNLAGAQHSVVKTVHLAGDTENIHILRNSSEVTQTELGEFLVQCNVHVGLKNFLIFQNEVEAITLKKSRDLTEIIEDISGSADAKAEYDTIKAKLEAINKKLTTLAMEKKEVSGEIHRFRAQKKEYDRFRDLHEKEKKVNTMKTLYLLLLNETELVEKKNALVRAQNDVDGLEKAYTEQVGGMKEKKLAFAEIHKKHLLSLKNVRDTTAKYRDANAQHEKLKTTLEHLEKQHSRLQGENSLQNKSVTTLHETIEGLQQSIEHKTAEQAAFEAQCRDEEEADDFLRLTPEHLTEYRKIRKEVDCDTVLLRQKMESTRKTSSIVEDSMHRDSLVLDDTNASIRATAERIGSCSDRIEGLKMIHAEAKDELTASKALYDTSRAFMQHAAQIEGERKTELRRVEAQLEVMQGNQEETNQAKRHFEALSAMKALTRGVRGRLVDLCTIPNEKYRIAATVALGKHLESIVVETQTHAMDCVRYLKDNRIGVMEFIPLDFVKGKHIDERCRGFGGTCRPIVDVFKYDTWLEPAVRYALGQTLVCDTIEEARRVAFNTFGTKYAVVTLDGSLILKNGAIQGGLQSVRERAKKWDEKAFAELKETRARLQMELFEASSASEAKKESDLAVAKQKLEAQQSRSKQIETEVSGLNEQISSLQAELKVLEQSREKAAKNIERSKFAISDLEKTLDTIHRSIRASEAKAFSKLQKKVGNCDLLKWEERKGQTASVHAEKRRQFVLQLSLLRNQLAVEQKKCDLRSTYQTDTQISDIKNRVASITTEMSTQQQILDKARKGSNESTAQLEAVKKQLLAIENEIRSFSRSGLDNNTAIADARKSALSSTMSCKKLRTERSNMFLRCVIENCIVPYVIGEDDPTENERKRHRRGKPDAALGEAVTKEAIDAMKLAIRYSEAFDVSDNPLVRSAITEVNASQGQPLSVRIDFNTVPEKQRQAMVNGTQLAELTTLERSVVHIREEINALAPNVKAGEKVTKREEEMNRLNSSMDILRDDYKTHTAAFHKVKDVRYAKFQHTFELINDSVARIYKSLTEGTRGSIDVHGTAYLTLDSQEEPYLHGTKYHATPPLKRFMGMEALSGGERTMAALSLLFALHSLRPAPFIVLDEVDAALDYANVQKLAQYFRAQSSVCQFVVVSLNAELYSKSDALFGVYKDKQRDSSAVLSVDLTTYAG